MTGCVILNPFSGRWRARREKIAVIGLLQAAGLNFRFVETEASRHATQLAREAALQGDSPIVAAGGDGLIGEVVNGIAQALGDEPWPTLGIIPLGSANDLVDNLRMPRELDAAIDVIREGYTRLMDVIQVNDYYFVNNGGLGLESYISTIQNRMTWARGTLRYLVATFRGILANPQWKMRLQWDDGAYEGPVTLVSIGNCPRTGGIFYTVPEADPFDGLLTFVHGHIPNRRGILQVLPRTMRSGPDNYTSHPAVHQAHATWLRVQALPATPMHADGEILETAITELTYQVLPARLPLLIPHVTEPK